MRISQLKRSITDMVEISSDKEFLEMIFNILEDREKHKDRDILDGFTDEHMNRLNLSLAQIERGQIVSHEEVMKSIRQKVANAKKRKMV